MFNLFLIVHIVTGIICLVSGLFAMLSKKKKGRHSLAGELYHGSFIVVFITVIMLSVSNWEESGYLLYIGVFSYGMALLGYLAVKIKWKNWLALHISGMLGSYIGIATATITVNISKIPLLNELPILLFWLLPTIIGTPIIMKIRKKYTLQKVR